MKKVIAGRVYNTETAELIANWSNGCSYSDFNYCEESLYITKKGSFFLHGEGGPNRGYARSCGANQFCGGASVKAFSKEEVLEWLEIRNIDAEEIEPFMEIKEA